MLIDVAQLERHYFQRRPDLSDPNQMVGFGTSGHRGAPLVAAIKAASTHQEDFILPYVHDLRNVGDMDAIRAAGLRLAAGPLGGAARTYWEPIIAKLTRAPGNNALNLSSGLA